MQSNRVEILDQVSTDENPRNESKDTQKHKFHQICELAQWDLLSLLRLCSGRWRGKQQEEDCAKNGWMM